MSKKKTPARKNRTWTPSDTEFLKENYSTLGPTKCAKQIGAPRPTVVHYAQKLGLTDTEDKPWTDAEIIILRDNINTGMTNLMKLLPGRTRQAIHAKRYVIGTRENIELEGHPKHFEDPAVRKRFRRLYAQGLNDKEIAEKLGPDFSRANVRYYRTTKAKLPGVKSATYIHWTPEQLAILAEFDGTTNIQDIVERTGKTESAVRRKWYRMNNKAITGDEPEGPSETPEITTESAGASTCLES